MNKNLNKCSKKKLKKKIMILKIMMTQTNISKIQKSSFQILNNRMNPTSTPRILIIKETRMATRIDRILSLKEKACTIHLDHDLKIIKRMTILNNHINQISKPSHGNQIKVKALVTHNKMDINMKRVMIIMRNNIQISKTLTIPRIIM